MTRYYHYLILGIILIIYLLTGCNKEIHPNDYYTIQSSKVINAESFVNWDQINDYASRCFPQTRSNDTLAYDIYPVTGDDADTLMYIINYGNGEGWKIISADNRTPAIIAESQIGSFKLETGNPSVRFWLDCISKDMKIIRQSPNELLNFDEDEIAVNRAFWAKDNLRGQPPVPYPGGHWEESISAEEFVVEQVEHLTPHWDQNAPYNLYCPQNSSDTTLRAPAGCVALAGAEVLYYLHNHIGIPSTMVSNGFCIGDINNYTRYFDSLNTTIWESMDSNYVSVLIPPYAEALMIGYVGSLTGMHYHNDYSWTFPALLRTNVFEPMGISCSHGNYDADTVKNSLENGLPVIVTASDLLIPMDFEIHCFVIDGYKKTYTQYTHHHYFVPDDPNTINPPGVNEAYDTYSYSSPSITAIKINWGWWSQWRPIDPLNDGWYSLTDDWYTIMSNGHEATYNHNRQMIYGFSISQ